MSNLRIATWNINSVRIRLPLLAQFITAYAPDMLCLQETKVEDSSFPHHALHELGFEHHYICGQKSYNGVAILSKQPLNVVDTHDFSGSGHKRHIGAALANGVEIHCVYVPAGGDIPDPALNPKFQDKLTYIKGLTDWSQETITGSKRATILLGDFNIAPLEQDVWSHKQLLNVVSHTPIEVEKLGAMKAAGEWIDCSREFVPHDEKLYSWWSYRARDHLASNRGRRLDHIWITPNMRSGLKAGSIAVEARGWDNPSDHVPVMIDLDLAEAA